jgi:hypothetical protein
MPQKEWAYGLMLGALAILAWQPARATAGNPDTVVPTTYESGHFYATPMLANGKRLRLVLDTGGGTTPTNWISSSQASRLGVAIDHECEIDGRIYKAGSPAFAEGSRLPDLSPLCRGVVVLPDKEAGGFSGQVVPFYFLGRVWTFDYPSRRVVIRGSAWQPPGDAHSAPVGFKTLADGSQLGWPRITVRVDGEELGMLLDSGATAKPTAEALREDPRTLTEGFTVGSYITESTMQRWIAKHPDWLVIEKGDVLLSKFGRMIRVPELDIAGWRVGPVWFIERPDQAFHSMMASLMDRPPEGAIGANVLERFSLTLDYKRREAWFQCPSGCSQASAVKPSRP